MENQKKDQNIFWIVVLSILLLFFTIPHTLEDFATGEPAKAGIPAPVLALVVSIIFAIQAMGLYWLGNNQRKGVWAHLAVGVFWPLASGFAQLPAILSEPSYRSGIISILYVVGIILIGLMILILAIIRLRKGDSLA